MNLTRLLRNLIRPYYYGLRFAVSRGRATVDVAGTHANFLVGSSAELQRVKGLRGERDLVSILLSNVRPGDVFWDVGANIGTHSILVGNKTGPKGNVVAFEPEPGAANRVRQNASENPGIQVAIVASPLGSSLKTSTLYVDDADSSGRHTLAPTDDFRSVSVNVVTGDSVVQSGEAQQPNLMKIDVEGYELEVLRGMPETLSSPSLRFVICEVHVSFLEAKNEQPDQVQELLAAAGFNKFDRSFRGNEFHLFATRTNPNSGA